jgi:hypothetical protein
MLVVHHIFNIMMTKIIIKRLTVGSQTNSCIKVYALVANKVFHECRHVLEVKLAFIVHIEVLPGAGKVLVHEFIKRFTT